MDVENFKRLFLPLHPKLFRIAYALVENKADAEDILQDAYYKLWSRRNELTDIQNPEAFCVTLVKNLCLDFLRSPRANRRDADVTEAVTLSTASSPDEELERQDKVQQIRHHPDVHQLFTIQIVVSSSRPAQRHLHQSERCRRRCRKGFTPTLAEPQQRHQPGG